MSDTLKLPSCNTTASLTDSARSWKSRVKRTVRRVVFGRGYSRGTDLLMVFVWSLTRALAVCVLFLALAHTPSAY